MPLPIPVLGDLIQFHIQGQLDLQTCMNVFHYTVASVQPGTGQPDIADCCQKIGDWLWDDAVNGMKFVCTNDFQGVFYAAQIIKPVRTLGVTRDPTVDTDGQAAGTSLPSGNALVVSRVGTTANRHNRGRVYIPGISETDVAGSEIILNSATDLAAASFAAQIPVDVSVTVSGHTTKLTPVLCPLPAGTPLVIIQAANTTRVVRYQRRREVRVGI